MKITRSRVTATITEENTFSNWVFLREKFNFSLSGIWVATVHLQRSFDSGATPLDIEDFTGNIEKIGEDPEGCHYRFGVKTGDYTSGSIIGRLSQ